MAPKLRGVAVALDVAYGMAGIFLLCVVGGFFFDRHFGSDPYGVLVGVLLATIMIPIHLWRALSRRKKP